MPTETIEFQGVRYRRYPESKRIHLRSYYWAGPADRIAGADCLHRDVCRAAHGPLPDGVHVHHKDGNTLNNDPSNLVALTPQQHRDEHHAECSPAQAAHLDRVRPLASAWHRSPEGRAWHSKNSSGRSLPRVHPCRCTHCGAEFLAQRRDSRLCGGACGAAARRASGVDDETRTCLWCGGEFRANRYAKTRACGASCAGHARQASLAKKRTVGSG